MNWKPGDDYHRVSECGFYVICKGRVADDHWVYSAAYRYGAVPSSKSGKAPLHLGCYQNVKQAEAVCVNHKSTSQQVGLTA